MTAGRPVRRPTAGRWSVPQRGRAPPAIRHRYTVVDMTRRLRFAVAAALAASVLVLPAGPASAAAGTAVAEFTPVTQWPGGYVGQMTVRNNTTEAIDGWRVEFDLAAQVTGTYGGVFGRSGDHWTVTDATWNGRLAPGASATFGWVAAGHITPSNCTLNGAPCSGVRPDHTPPSRPGPMTTDLSTGYALTWGPSTDDRGPVTYEVYDAGALIGTTTGTRHVVSDGPYLPPKLYVFAVRAVDAAGNPSPYAFVPLGSMWRDEPPAAPAAVRVDAAGAGLLRVSWTAPPAQSPYQVAPIAGYRVLVDGEPAGDTGATSLVIAAPPAGPHTITVRAFDAMDRLSEPAAAGAAG